MRKLVAIAVVVLVGALVGVAGRAMLNARQPVAAPLAGLPGIVATTAPTPVAIAPAIPAMVAPTAAPVPARVVAAPTPVPSDVVVEVTEGELETRLRDAMLGHSLGSTPLGDARLESLTVRLRDQLVQVGGGARVGPFNTPFTAAGTVAPSAAGRPIVSVQQATLGGVVLPDAARDALAESVQSQVDELFEERKLSVRSIEIEDGKMRVVGTQGS